jgi:hypothetical protein
LTFRGKTTTRIPYNAGLVELQEAIEALTTIGTGNINLVMFTTQACNTVGAVWTVEFLQAFGSLPLLVADISLLTFSDLLSSPYLVVSKQTEGTKEDAQCSNRGICDQTTGVRAGYLLILPIVCPLAFIQLPSCVSDWAVNVMFIFNFIKSEICDSII